MDIRILIDNHALPGLRSEWGLAMAVTLDNSRLWFWDAGAGPAFLENARRMGVIPAEAVGLALSHGHYDHGGGIPALIEAGFQGPIYAHPEVNRSRFHVEAGTNTRDIGLPARLDGFHEVTGTRLLDRGLTMLTDITRRPGLPEMTTHFYRDPEGDTPDDVPDDACLVADSVQGPVLILGCCHSGLENTLLDVRERLDIDRIHAVVGGMHLHRADAAGIDAAAKAIVDAGVAHLHPGHCTGDAAMDALAQRLDCPVVPLASGQVVRF